MSRARTLVLIVGGLLLVCAICVGVLGFNARAAADRIPDGVTIAGLDVGGMDADEARALIEQRIVEPAARPVRVEIDGKTSEITAEGARVSIDVESAVRAALDHGDDGNFITRGWRELTGGKIEANERLTVRVDKRAVARFVDRLARSVEKPAVDAQLQIAVDSVTVSDAQDGQRLDRPKALAKQIVRAFKHPRGPHELTAETAKVPAAKTAEQVWAETPTVVTVSRSGTTARVFDRGELTISYTVAVGDPQYPTPTGTFAVQSMQVDPPWNVPNSEWAGDLAGQTIPGGAPNNPLIARWIGFDGAVGFHGTNDVGSIGSAASHGCVRMRPDDVIDLYERVRIGTPVVVVA